MRGRPRTSRGEGRLETQGRAIKAVLFDIDGVLVHPWRFRDRLARDRGITPAMTAPFFREAFLPCIEGRADLVDVLPPFLPAWGWPGSAADFVAEWFSVENAPNEALLEIVSEVRRSIPCYVASNQEHHRARYIANEMRFALLFDGLFFSSHIGVAKPEARFYQAVASILGSPGSDLLFFDDSVANVDGARAAGWRAEPFTTVEQLREDLDLHTGLVLRGS